MLRFQSIACLVLRHPLPLPALAHKLTPSFRPSAAHTCTRRFDLCSSKITGLAYDTSDLRSICLLSPLLPLFSRGVHCYVRLSLMPCVALFSGLCLLLRILCILDRCYQSYCCFVRCSVESFARSYFGRTMSLHLLTISWFGRTMFDIYRGECSREWSKILCIAQHVRMYITMAYFPSLLQLAPSQIHAVAVATVNVRDNVDVCTTRFRTAGQLLPSISLRKRSHRQAFPCPLIDSSHPPPNRPRHSPNPSHPSPHLPPAKPFLPNTLQHDPHTHHDEKHPNRTYNLDSRLRLVSPPPQSIQPPIMNQPRQHERTHHCARPAKHLPDRIRA